MLALEKDVAFLRNRCDTLDRQLDDSKRQHRTARIDCDALQKDLSFANRSMHAAHADREVLSKKLDDAREYAKKLEARLLVSAKMSGLPKQQHHNQADELRDRLRSVTATNDAISTEVQILEARLSEVEAENDTLRSALQLREQDLGFPLSQGKDIKQSLLFSLSATRQESRLLGLELAQRAASQHELQAQERMLNSQLRSYAERIQQLESDCDRYQDEHSRMKGMISDLSAQVEDLRNERDYMLQYLKTEASKAEDLQEMLTKLQLEKIQLNKDSKDGGGRHRTDASVLQKQLSALLLEKEELSETLIIEHQKVAQLEQQLRQAKTSPTNGQAAGAASAGMAIKIQSLNAEAEDREAVISLMQAQLKQKSDECERLRSSLPQQPHEEVQHKAKIAQLSEQVLQLQAENAQLLKMANEMRARAAASIEEQKAQAEELEFLRADTNTLSRSKQELQHTLLDQINSLRKENLELRSRCEDAERAGRRGSSSSFGTPMRSPLLSLVSSTATPLPLQHSPPAKPEKLQVGAQKRIAAVSALMCSPWRCRCSRWRRTRALDCRPEHPSAYRISVPIIHACNALCMSPPLSARSAAAPAASGTQSAFLPSSQNSPAFLSARGTMQSPSESRCCCCCCC